MATASSPLRYPGGKQVLARILSHLIKLNGAQGGTYAEPYAGGAGAALSLLFGGHVERILINDADPCIHAFWTSAVGQTDAFVNLLKTTRTTIPEWKKQRAIYLNEEKHSRLRVGFATFFLNRCNRSGIIGNGGPIGGKDQTGKWKIDARFNREDLERRIRKISLYSDRIEISNLDGIDFLKQRVVGSKEVATTFVYLDPPYFAKGADLYLNHYKPEDHSKLSAFLNKKTAFNWVLSYDAVPQIVQLYKKLRQVSFGIDYSARERRIAREIMILKNGLAFPTQWAKTIPSKFVTASDDPLAFPIAA